MNYQRQESNGTVLETINGKHYVNGVEVETGDLKNGYYVIVVAVAIVFFLVGLFVGGLPV